MTEDKNPQPQERGFFSSLESAKKQRRAFHIPTAPAAAVRLVQNLNRKGASSTTVQTLPQAHPSIGKDLTGITRARCGPAQRGSATVRAAWRHR